MTGPVLMHVAPEDLRRFWPMIRDRVAELCLLDNDAPLPEDVYCEILTGGTHLFTTSDVRGFIIAQVLSNPYSRRLHVWFASNAEGDWTPQFFDQLKDIAAVNSCQRVTFVSDRTGWKRALPGVRATTLYSVEVGDNDV